VDRFRRLKAQLAAVEADLIGVYDAAFDWAVGEHRSAATAMRHHGRMHGGEAAGLVALARALRTMPGTTAALADGAITVNHARRLAKAAARPEFAGDGEAFLVGKAGCLSFKDFARAVTHWENVVDEARRGDDDPEPPDPRETKRRLHVSKTLDDMGRLDGWLDPIGHATFHEALRRIEAEFFDADWQQAKKKFGDAVTIDRLWRTPAQRRADALVEMAIRASTSPADGRRPLPLVIIHTDVDTFEHALARVLGAEPPERLGTERLCELDDGTVISPTQMIEQALLGHVRRLVYEAPGVILDYGRTRRLFTGALRQAICARDRQCAHDGCEIPARHCEIDHIQPWDNGGVTSHRNGKARCSFHHRNWKPPPAGP
jgi:hypothetical protein